MKGNRRIGPEDCWSVIWKSLWSYWGFAVWETAPARFDVLLFIGTASFRAVAGVFAVPAARDESEYLTPEGAARCAGGRNDRVGGFVVARIRSWRHML